MVTVVVHFVGGGTCSHDFSTLSDAMKGIDNWLKRGYLIHESTLPYCCRFHGKIVFFNQVLYMEVTEH